MARIRAGPARPHGRGEWEFVGAGRDGAYWLRSDGLMVRVAAAEREPNAKRAQAELAPENVRLAPASRLVFGR